MKTLKARILAALAAIAVVVVGGAAYVLASGTVPGPQATSAAPVLYDQDAITALYQNVSPAIVEIEVAQTGSGFFGRSFTEGQGSGFLVDTQGHILTNNHVVDGATSVQVVLSNGTSVDATVVGTDPVDDLALVKVDTSAVSGLTPLQLGNSSAVKPGQMAIAIGSPYGLANSITVGVISGVDRTLSRSGQNSLTGMLQTDAAINPGNSGGPLLNAQGQVIGINAAIETANGARGIGFAVASDVASKALPSLMAGQQITRPWLGISGLDLTATRAKELGLTVNQGIYVVTVMPDSPAAQAGLKGSGSGTGGTPASGGDVITAADGKAMTSVQGLSAYLNTKKVGDKVELSVLRGGQSVSVTVTLAAWPAQTSPNTTQPTPTPRSSTPWGQMPRGPMPWSR